MVIVVWCIVVGLPSLLWPFEVAFWGIACLVLVGMLALARTLASRPA